MIKRELFVLFLAALIGAASQAQAIDSTIEEAVLANDWVMVDSLLEASGLDSGDPIAGFLKRQICLTLDRKCAPSAVEGLASEKAEIWPCWEWVKALKENHPDNAVAVFLNADAEALTGSSVKARAGYTKALELDETLVMAYFSRGSLLYSMGLASKAVDDYGRALKLRPDFCKALINRGTVFDYMGEHWKAIFDYRAALKLGRDSAAAHYNRGNSYRALGENGNAIIDFSSAIRADSSLAAAWFNRANTYRDQGETEKAARDYREFLRLAPDEMGAQIEFTKALFRSAEAGEDQTDTTLFGTRMSDGSRHFSYGRYNEAIKKFTSAIEIRPSESEAYYWRGASYMYRGSDEPAIADFSRAVRLHPNDTTAWFNRATCHSRCREYAEAVSDFTRAINLKSGYAGAFYGRAWASEMLGNYEMAIEDYRQFLQHASAKDREENPGAHEAIDYLSAGAAETDKSPISEVAAATYRALAKRDWAAFAAHVRHRDLRAFHKKLVPVVKSLAGPDGPHVRLGGVYWNTETLDEFGEYSFFEKMMDKVVLPHDSQVDKDYRMEYVGPVDCALRGNDKARCRTRIRVGVLVSPVELIQYDELKFENGQWKMPIPHVIWSLQDMFVESVLHMKSMNEKR